MFLDRSQAKESRRQNPVSRSASCGHGESWSVHVLKAQANCVSFWLKSI